MHSEFWSQGIEAEPTVASLYSARAEAFSKLNKIEDSLNDAVKVLALKDGTATEMAGAELEARQSRSRRLQMDWEEVEERASAPPASVPPPNAKPQVLDVMLGSAGDTHKATPKKIYPPPEVIYPPVKGAPSNGSPANGSPGQPAVHTRHLKQDEQQGLAEADEGTVKHAEKFLDSIQLLADVLSRYPFLANDKAATSLTQCLAGVCVRACVRACVRESVCVYEAQSWWVHPLFPRLPFVGYCPCEEHISGFSCARALSHPYNAQKI